MQIMRECPCCGQQQLLEVPENFTDEQITEAALLKCDCDDAAEFRERKRDREERLATVNRAKMNASALFGDDMPNVAAVLRSAIDLIAAGEVSAISINSKRTVASAKASGRKIKVKRTDKSERALESEF